MSVPAPISSGKTGKANWSFFGRQGGVSKKPFDSLNVADHVKDKEENVFKNREILAENLAMPLVYIQATHSPNVVNVQSEFPEVHVDTDALVTRETNLGLVIMSADCAPIVLVDPIAHVVGVVHAGWQGMLVGVVANAVEGMFDLGVEPENLKAIIGPTISAQNFLATQERFDEVKDIVPTAAVKLANGQLAVDIRKGVKHQLAQYQIKTTDVNICTFDTPELFSFRRDPETGRNATVVWLSQ
jgi:YfiH family protein